MEVCNRMGKYHVSKPVLTKFQQSYLKNTANNFLNVNISFKKYVHLDSFYFCFKRWLGTQD